MEAEQLRTKPFFVFIRGFVLQPWGPGIPQQCVWVIEFPRVRSSTWDPAFKAKRNMVPNSSHPEAAAADVLHDHAERL